jgi:hypothetical protein
MSFRLDIARKEIEAMSSGWALNQFLMCTMDVLSISLISHKLKNDAVKLLMYLSYARYLFGGLWLLIASEYSTRFSDSLCAAIWMLLEIGWFIADHTASLSTIQKTFPLVKSRQEKKLHMLVLGISVIIGLILRVIRNMCRFGVCMIPSTDSFISINVILMEMYLIGVISFKIFLSYKKTLILTRVMKDGITRVQILLPLGILEAIGYYLQYLRQNNVYIPNSLIWITEVGIYARMLYPTILGISILKTRLNIAKATGLSSKSIQ